MPSRDPKIPTHRERSALQLMKHGNWIAQKGVYPAGEHTIATLVRKGWIERSGSKEFRITQAGKAALAAKIP
jgi:hypothetical protein